MILYHVAKPDGTKIGQLDAGTISAKLSAGEITADCLIWTEGWEDWKPVTELTGSAVAASAPAVAASWNVVNAFKTVYFYRFACFSGRASRSEYWWSTLGIIIIAVMAAVVTLPAGETATEITGNVLQLLTMVPGLALAARRCHDINLSAWSLLVLIIPFVNLVFTLYLVFCPSKPANKWGAGPDGPAC